MKYYNEKIFHESLDNLTHINIYLGQGEKNQENTKPNKEKFN